MKNNYFNLLVLTFLISQLSFSQQMPLDFSDSADNFVTFGGTSFSIVTDPTDSGNDVGRIVNTGGNWEGSYLNLSRSIDLDFQKTITLSFYSYNSNNHNIVLKLENGTNADVEVTKNVSSMGWTNTITFDFANAVYSGGSTAVNASGTYNTITVFVDGGNTTTGTYLIDNIDDGTTPIVYPPNPVYDYLVWSDEFNVDGAVNSSNWYHQTKGPNGGRWYNGEEQHYTNLTENSYVLGGHLNIVAIEKEAGFTQDGVKLFYTSARLNSKFAFTYGRVDVRAKLPSVDGSWPAIWTLGKNVSEVGAYWYNDFGTVGWPACGEIDIMEHGLGAVNHTSSALHTPCLGCSGNTMNTKSQLISDVATNWHIYSVNWSPNQITFLVDDVAYYTYNPADKSASSGTWPFVEDQFLLLNVAMGGIAARDIPDNFSLAEGTMTIDYVRVYQSNPLSDGDNHKSDIKVFPNPANSNININSKVPLDRVEVYDILGKLMFSESRNTINLDVSSLKSGLYILNIYSESNKIVKKIVVN